MKQASQTIQRLDKLTIVDINANNSQEFLHINGKLSHSTSYDK